MVMAGAAVKSPFAVGLNGVTDEIWLTEIGKRG
jgi:hypothetical protein